MATLAASPASLGHRQLPSCVEWAHWAVERHLKAGGVALDATVGNGRDTLFLAQQVGAQGHVFGFDVQSVAISAATELLRSEGVDESRVTLYCASHADLLAHLPDEVHGRVGCAIFNLGYLPGGDKTVTTQAETTVAALTVAASVLATGGLLCVVAYSGHTAGALEAQAVESWMEALDTTQFEVQQVRAVNRLRTPPTVWMVLRLGAA